MSFIWKSSGRMLMHIIIAGATGFIGTAMVKRYLTQNHQLTVIGRDAQKIHQQFPQHVTPLTWQQLLQAGAKIFQTADLIINLAGADIGKARWSETRKQEILASRVNLPPPSHLYARN